MNPEELTVKVGELISQAGDLRVAVDTVWVMVAAMMVFFMNAGFGMLETGFNRGKNAVNILSKNFIVFALASFAFWLLGWGLMFGDGNGFMGLQGLWTVGGADNSPAVGDAYQGVYGSIAWAGVPLWAKFFFQLVFAATAATIVSGAVAERVKYFSFIVFSLLLVGIVYPVVGHWIWGGGWLGGAMFHDFAGSTVVHSVGGWAALAGILVLGPRFGKYNADGSANAIPGHSLPLATLGTLILWLGWYGFNPGSTMAADPGAIAHVAVTTTMAAALGALSATLVSLLVIHKPDLGMTLNGVLAGLVAITAPCAFVSVNSAVLIGIIAGAIVVLGVLTFDKLQIDDPVGALSVHLLNGIFGTLAVGLWGAKDRVLDGTPGYGLLVGGGAQLFLIQLKGVVAVGAFTFTVTLVLWLAVKALMGVRVKAEEEIIGLDISEHGNSAYPEAITRKTAFSSTSHGKVA